MTTREIQEVDLQILLNIHDFCQKNDIRYSLAYGTLIGAIRHKGFIPWDDDIDIWMTRENYEKFISAYQSSEKFMLTSYKTKGNFLDFARVYEVQETEVHGDLADHVKKTGVWVDIFPLDSVSDDESTRLREHSDLKKIWWNIRRLRELYIKKHRRHPLKKMKAWLIYLFRIMRYGSVEQLIRRSNEMCCLHEKEQTQYMASLMSRDAFRSNKMQLYPTEWLVEYTTTSFEGYECCVFEKYEEILKYLYNNYMELPPVEKRVASQDGHDFFWVNK